MDGKIFPDREVVPDNPAETVMRCGGPPAVKCLCGGDIIGFVPGFRQTHAEVGVFKIQMDAFVEAAYQVE